MSLPLVGEWLSGTIKGAVSWEISQFFGQNSLNLNFEHCGN